ncbi:diguanylate cyclase domain-containing protein [Fibrobacter succinogenes]|uniref:diguanylate cyclase n=1 Tax=Fibrobacter succinogenes TaxID=833 RepID=A0A380S7T2_FIBSU|nr:diguanylate cyclase [Fibrobacter succinogenes]PWJ34665.1 diguanylate cyclase (GGDEF)-like protein [Fibrobacter succinogenes subsp. elongatus]SUQ24788.1 diguanylate cyclase (GGDEF) domain-containing protein [Fibrobacter succinogenes]
MNFDVLLSHYRAKACVVSVEFFPDGTYGNIRVVAGNKAHCDDMAALNHPFEPGCPYEACFPKNPNFEDHCFRCIRDGKPLHAYVDLYMMGLWLNMFLMPLDSDQENIGYCIYCYDVAPKADSSAMADLSADTAADVLKACIKLRGSQNIRQAFQEVIEDIGAICGSDHCCVLLTDDEKHECTTFAEFLREGSCLYPMSRYIQGFYEIAQTWPDTLAGSTCIIIKDEHDMEKLQEQNPIWKASLEQAGVKTVVLYPLRHGGELLGYMWALNFNVENVLKIKETLELTTFFLASEISNYLLLDKLKILSTIDTLTSVRNRNEMNNRVDRIVAGNEPVPQGVLFADLNGLKRVNDEQGHAAGDMMLRAAASILQSVFHDGEVYRAGGDEFMILVNEISEDDVQDRVARVHFLSGKTENVRFSIGVCYGKKNIRKAMRLADERMYAFKNGYYEAHPELKYR